MALQDCSKLLADGSRREGQGRIGTTGPILLSRGACRMRYVALAHVQSIDRPRALLNVLRAWAPFDSTGWQLVPQAEGCLAIAWDAERVSKALSQAGWNGRQVLCETLAREPSAAGLRLVRGIDGFEGQHWEPGKLQHSRWWAAKPDPDSWLEFLRASGVDHQALSSTDGPVPAVQEIGWLHRPFGRPRPAEAFGSSAARWERLSVMVTAAALTVLSGAQARQAFEAWQGLSASTAELDRLKKDAEPVITLRQRVLTSSSQVERLSSQLSGPAPIEVLAHLSDLLPQKGVVLRQFDLNGLKVRAEFDLDPSVSRSMVIGTLQRSPWFADISEARDALGRGVVPFEFRLRQTSRPGASTAPASAEPTAAAPSGAGQPVRPQQTR
jgi:hypothetical protein